MPKTELVMIDLKDRLGRFLATSLDHDKKTVTGMWIEDTQKPAIGDRVLSGEDLYSAIATASHNARLIYVLANIIADLPSRRDWLDPSTEQMARDLLKGNQ